MWNLTNAERRKIYKPRLEFRRELEASAPTAHATSMPVVMRTRPSDGTAAVLTPVYSWFWTLFIVLGYCLFIVPILIRHLICIFNPHSLLIGTETGQEDERGRYNAMPWA